MKTILGILIPAIIGVTGLTITQVQICKGKGHWLTPIELKEEATSLIKK